MRAKPSSARFGALAGLGREGIRIALLTAPAPADDAL